MGWWSGGRDGSSLHAEDTGMLWGDGPADSMDDALNQIVGEFRTSVGRYPTGAEIRAGLEFSLMGVKDDEEYPPEDMRG